YRALRPSRPRGIRGRSRGARDRVETRPARTCHSAGRRIAGTRDRRTCGRDRRGTGRPPSASPPPTPDHDSSKRSYTVNRVTPVSMGDAYGIAREPVALDENAQVHGCEFARGSNELDPELARREIACLYQRRAPGEDGAGIHVFVEPTRIRDPETLPIGR